MITAAALCPSPPLLAREVTGRADVLPELRLACAEVTGRLVSCTIDVVAVVGAAPVSRAWSATGRLNLAAFAPQAAAQHAAGRAATGPDAGGRSAPGRDVPGPALPLSLGLGNRLLDEAGYAGPRDLRSVSFDAPVAECVALGEHLAGLADRVGLLVMADGSARRGLRAPGHLDERSAGFDAGVERALRDGDLRALLGIDPELAAHLLAAGRPAWQVLAGAVGERAVRSEIRYADDPFGVFYLAGWLMTTA